MACSYNNQPCNLTQDFSVLYSFTWGTCFSFNSGTNMLGEPTGSKKVYATDKKHGLTLQLFSKNSVKGDQREAGLAGGGVFLIHDQSVWPNMWRKGTLFPAEAFTDVVFSKTVQHQYPKPYSPCQDNLPAYPSEYVQILFANNRTYTQFDCIGFYEQELMVQNCNCYLAPSKSQMLSASKKCGIQCTTQNQIICATDSQRTARISEETLNEVCPLECDRLTYDMFMSKTDFPQAPAVVVLANHPTIVKYLGKNATSLDIKQSVLAVNFYKGKDTYTLIQESPKMNVFDLIGKIGGHLGLFLGMSLLTCVEFFELAYIAVAWLLKKVFRKKKVENQQFSPQPFFIKTR